MCEQSTFFSQSKVENPKVQESVLCSQFEWCTNIIQRRNIWESFAKIKRSKIKNSKNKNLRPRLKICFVLFFIWRVFSLKSGNWLFVVVCLSGKTNSWPVSAHRAPLHMPYLDGQLFLTIILCISPAVSSLPCVKLKHTQSDLPGFRLICHFDPISEPEKQVHFTKWRHWTVAVVY